jgi:DNA-binding response OmpR family regulator
MAADGEDLTAALGRAPRLCVVEESRAVRSFIASAVAPLAAVVTEIDTAADLEPHLREAGERRPDVILTEATFRSIDALGLLRRLCGERPEAERPSVLVFTGLPAEEIRAPALKAGVDSVLLKPAAAELLCARVRMLLWNRLEAARLEPLPGVPALVIEEDPETQAALRRALLEAGHPVLLADNPPAALRLCHEQTGLAFLSLTLEEADPLRLLRALRGRVPALRVVALAAAAKNPALEAALAAGARAWLRRPVRPSAFAEALEQALQPSVPLAELELERDLLRRHQSSPRPLPPFVEADMPCSFAAAARFLSDRPELETAGGLVSLAAVTAPPYGRPPPGAAAGNAAAAPLLASGEAARELVLEEGTPLTAATARRLERTAAAAPEAVGDLRGRPVRGLTLACTYDLGRCLYDEEPVTAAELRAELAAAPCALGAALGEREDAATAETLAVLVDLCGYLDVLLLQRRLARRGRHALRRHLLSVGGLAVLCGRTCAAAQGLEGARREGLLAALGLAGLLHDLGLEASAPAATTIPERARHAEAGAERLAPARLFTAVKAMVRDHHRDLRRWSSRYDRATRLLQLADHLDNLCRAGGWLVVEDDARPSPEPYTPGEACLILEDRARSGRYRPEDLALLREALGQAG